MNMTWKVYLAGDIEQIEMSLGPTEIVLGKN